MCGFVGIRRFDGAPVDPVLLRGLSERLAHRGPDGSGTWIGEGIGLAHRRLAIIDPTGSPQPATSDDGRAHVCFNGEILNYRELRASLDYPFHTGGDTEVLLALHRRRGPVGADELRGQFAYALHDEVDEVTWLVRDRLGILPLFLLRTDSFVAFASEAKALLPLVAGGAAVDEGALDSYLRRRAVPAPRTLYRGIEKVLPGHVVRITPDGRVAAEPFWSLPDADEVGHDAPAEAVARVSAALEDAVRANLVADVPVGTYLSGGVDSSLITALVTRVKGTGVHTFAAGFGDPRVDELDHARAVSRHLGTHHTEVEVGPADFEAEWSRLTRYRDAPLSEPADLAVHRLAVAAADTVKVVLSGEGSDELFAGYPKHRFARATAWAGIVPRPLRELTASAADRMPASATSRRLGVMARALAAPTEAARVEAWFSPFTEGERRDLLVHEAPPPWVPPARDGDPLRRMLASDAGPWLSDNLLERGDRMTMAASVELRPPFLDHPLVELAFRLPSAVKVHDGTGKWVVKEVARPLLPPGIVDRPKAGFRVPLDAWFRDGLRDFAWDHLLGPTSFATSVFDRRAIRSLLERHDAGRRDEAIRIWTLLGLEVWHDACIKDLPAGPPPGLRPTGPAAPSALPGTDR